MHMHMHMHMHMYRGSEHATGDAKAPKMAEHDACHSD